MDNLKAVLWIEFRKIFRSKVPFFCNLAFMLAPLMVAFMMFIYKDPEFAKKLGLLSMKAEVIGKSADWPSYLGMDIAIIAMMGIFLFSLIESWIFGREYTEGTLKDMLAVPVSRGTIVAGKFIVLAVVCLAMTLETILIGVAAGYLLELPLGSPALITQGMLKLLLAAGMVLLVNTPFAFLASAGKGYLLPIGLTMLAVITANLVSALGWGDYFPWYIPSILSGMAAEGSRITGVSYGIIFATAVIGIAATVLWWQKADHQ
jgi:ABC-2 type transport system permease protein